ncbi:MAG: hypothetical protein KGH60_00975 [Candidatus Micrarchaeota archaeon]|nr:hypothetical protein [Candidatus Micrarchaeota archaeon]
MVEAVINAEMTQSAAHAHAHEEDRKREGGALKRYAPHIATTAIYLLIALVMFYPITLNMTSVVPGTGGDSFQNLWDIWWVNYATFNLHSSIYMTNLLFWPVGVNLAFQTLTPLSALVSAPFQAVNLIFAYNVLFFLGFALSGLTMFILADYLVKNKYAAFIAGIIFAFSAFHIAQSYAHIDFIALEWVPLFLYFFLRILHEKRSIVNIVGMSACFAFATLMGVIQISLMLLLIMFMIIVAYLINKPTRKTILRADLWISLVIFAVIAFIIGAWNFVPILQAISHPGSLATANALNDVQHNAIWSNNLLAFFVPSFYNGIFYNAGISSGLFYSIYAPDPSERAAYVGYVVMALALFGILKHFRQVRLWIAGTLIFGWLSIGPILQIGSAVTQIPGLYYLYHLIPVINIIREPSRFGMIMIMFIAILAAFGVKSLIERIGKSNVHVTRAGMYKIISAVAVIALLMLIENNGTPFGAYALAQYTTHIQTPQVYKLIGNLTGNFSTLSLPAFTLVNSSTPDLYTGKATYYSTITKKPLVGGYTSRSNITDQLLLYNIPLAVQASSIAEGGNFTYASPVAQNYTNQTILTLYNYNTEFITIDKTAYKSQNNLLTLINYMVSTFGNPVYNDNTTLAFSTVSAINKTVYRSYVAYPVISQWNTTAVPINGTVKAMWVPINGGSVEVYAPVAKTAKNFTLVNTTIRINAMSSINGTETLQIGEPGQSGVNLLGSINVTDRLSSYTVNVPLVSGPEGTALLFLPQSPNYPVFITNISFSARGK